MVHERKVYMVDIRVYRMNERQVCIVNIRVHWVHVSRSSGLTNERLS